MSLKRRITLGAQALAELDELEQRILQKFPQPKNFMVWRYDFVGRDGQVKRSNLPQPTMQSRFVKIDAVKRQREAAAAPHRILIEDDFITPKKLMSDPAAGLPPLEDDDHGQSFGASHPRHVRPARGSTALFGEHPPQCMCPSISSCHRVCTRFA